MTFETPITGQVIITTSRFVLRPLRSSDLGLIDLYHGDIRVARGTRNVPHPLPPGATKAFIARSLDEERIEDVWAMDGTASDHAEVLGLIALERMDRSQSEIAFWVAPAFWNTGFATEAVQALLDANPQDSAQIYAAVFQDNPGSARVLTNCGFEYLGDAEAHSVARAANVPTWTYAWKRDG